MVAGKRGLGFGRRCGDFRRDGTEREATAFRRQRFFGRRSFEDQHVIGSDEAAEDDLKRKPWRFSARDGSRHQCQAAGRVRMFDVAGCASSGRRQRFGRAIAQRLPAFAGDFRDPTAGHDRARQRRHQRQASRHSPNPFVVPIAYHADTVPLITTAFYSSAAPVKARKLQCASPLLWGRGPTQAPFRKGLRGVRGER